MKKAFLLFVLSALIVLSFSGCRKAESSANGDTPMPGYTVIDII